MRTPGTTAITTDAALDARRLQQAMAGPVILPGDGAYDEARTVWNGAIDRFPAAIARCAGTADVVAAVGFARERGLLVSVRGGGHNVAGSAVCDGGLVIDLSRMTAIDVDPRAGTARAQPGVVWRDLDRATAAHGLATTGGIQSTTGIAGFTLGGGIGWLSRRQGHACDNLRSATLVTADARVVTASAEENSDLFFGLRGGGGNFGVVTRFEYALHPVDRVVGGMVWHPADRTARALEFFRDWSEALPDDVGAILFLLTAPDAPNLPAALRGRPAVTIGVCHAGPGAEGARALAALRRFGPPAGDLVRAMRYTELQLQLDAANPPGHHNYWKAEYLSGLDDGAIAAIVEHGERRPPGLSKVLVMRLGGVAGRPPEGSAAFGHRDAPYLININAMGPDRAGREGRAAWVRAFWDALRPASYGGVYVNFLGDEGADRVRSAYPAATLARLVDLKRRYDPTNLFRMNQNIRP